MPSPDRSRSPRRGVAAGVAAFVVLAVAAPASYAQQSELSLRFTSESVAAHTGMQLHIVYRDPAHPDGKPSPIRHLEILAPAGTAFHVGSVPRCDASDQQLQLEGPSACPADSRVASGTLTAITGFGPPIDPFATVVSVFNDGDGWVEDVQDVHSGATVGLDRIQIHGDKLTGNPPTTPGGPPDGQTAVRTIDFTFPAATGYVTTPSTCPRARTWATSGSFTFADGSTQHVASTTPCRARTHARRRRARRVRRRPRRHARRPPVRPQREDPESRATTRP